MIIAHNKGESANEYATMCIDLRAYETLIRHGECCQGRLSETWEHGSGLLCYGSLPAPRGGSFVAVPTDPTPLQLVLLGRHVLARLGSHPLRDRRNSQTAIGLP
jgi:hypothetical protein